MKTITFNDGKEQRELNIEETLELQDMTPEEVRTALIKASGNFAYWSDIKTRLKRKKDKLTSDFDVWYAKKYILEVKRHPSKSDTFKEQYIITNNLDEWEAWQRRLRNVGYSHAQCNNIVEAYKLQATTLGSVAYMVKVEWDKMVKHGDGNIENM